MPQGSTGLVRIFALLSAIAFVAPIAHAQRDGAQPRLHVALNEALDEIIIEVEPLNLPANRGHVQVPPFHGRIPVDGWLHGFRIEMVSGRGQPAPRSMLHHVNVIVPTQRELFSPIMLRIAAAGQETAPVGLPRLLGYRVRRDQEIIVTSMMHNTTGKDYSNVRLRVHFRFTPAESMRMRSSPSSDSVRASRSAPLIKPMGVVPFYMDVMPPASRHSFDLPPGRSRKTWEARPAVNGRILGIGGHVHRYGTALRLEDVTAKKIIWEGKPTVDRDGQVAGMPVTNFVWRLGVPIHKNHVYRLVAEYNNPTGKPIPGGGMGALGGVMRPDRKARWPGIDRNDPQLKVDWELVHTGPETPQAHKH